MPHLYFMGNQVTRVTMLTSEPTIETPVYRKVMYKGPPEHATPLWLISCDEGWRTSIVCTDMYEWAADWLLEQIQGKPFASELARRGGPDV